MSLLQAIFLGAIHGIAEFFPVSASGHLAALRELLRIGAFDPLFTAFLRIGTLIAVGFYCRRELRALLSELAVALRLKKPASGGSDAIQRRLLAFLAVGTLPLLLVLLCGDLTAVLSQNLFFIAFAMLVNGMILFVSDRYGRGRKTVRKMTIVDALLIGASQLLAVFPGLSRSGAAISAGLARGLERRFSLRYAFLLSVPAIFGAAVVSLISAPAFAIDWGTISLSLAGMAFSALGGYGALHLLNRMVRRGLFGCFTYYCWGAGAVVLFLALIS